MATISISFNAMQTTNFKVKNIWGDNASDKIRLWSWKTFWGSWKVQEKSWNFLVSNRVGNVRVMYKTLLDIMN